MTDIPLKILIIDPDDLTADRLYQALGHMSQTVLSVRRTNSLVAAENALADSEINSIYIDPLLLGIDSASQFIFNIMSKVFVLYLDFSRMESSRAEFYSGKRRRFHHYFKLDKLTPITSFTEEVEATVRLCQSDLAKFLNTEKIQRLQNELSSIRESTDTDILIVPKNILQDIQKQLEFLKVNTQEKLPGVKAKSVFLSYRFAETEYVDGLRKLLEREGFSITTGREANTYISQAILERIRSCEFFLCLMTRADEKKDSTFATSPWLLEEKGAAIAMGKKIVLMVEDGVSDIGGLQGDWQRIHFSPKSFTNAAIQAVDQL
ncbi:TIR domain-containing protein, partial [Chloroflexota bacterium]